MTKILFLNVTGSTNKGDMAYVIGHINCIRQYLVDAEITILSLDMNVDKIFEDYDVTVEPHRWYRIGKSKLLSSMCALLYISRDVLSRLLCDVARIFNNKCHHFYDRYDLVIDPHADGFNEPYYGFWETLFFSINLLLAQLIIRKPIIMGPASVGPLTSKFNKWLTRFLLNRMTVITLREKASEDYLRQDLAINKPRIYLVDDLAFLLEPSFSERVIKILEDASDGNAGKKPIVGVTANYGMAIWNKPPDYTLLMAQCVGYIIEKLDAKVLLIPQEGRRKYKKNRVASDSVVCSEIYSYMRDKDAVTIVSNEITPEEWKAIIGSCDLAIGCRLHCSIMSLSMGVPTVTLAYGRKVNAIIGERMGQADTLVSIENSDFAQILSNLQAKIDYVWENRQRIRGILKEKSNLAVRCALTYGTLVKQLV